MTTKVEKRTLKIAGENREVTVICEDNCYYEVQVRILKKRYLGVGDTLAEAIHQVEEAIKRAEEARSMGLDPILAERAKRRHDLGINRGMTFSPKKFRELGGK